MWRFPMAHPTMPASSSASWGRVFPPTLPKGSLLIPPWKSRRDAYLWGWESCEKAESFRAGLKNKFFLISGPIWNVLEFQFKKWEAERSEHQLLTPLFLPFLWEKCIEPTLACQCNNVLNIWVNYRLAAATLQLFERIFQIIFFQF